ncbi:MAG TPA: nuclear transport factor 2 family protein [Candidatus Acidoferrales bacterium]|nr:nuclear transport factor 2 family protein [Candidatus Acidoferrales bacterium]
MNPRRMLPFLTALLIILAVESLPAQSSSNSAKEIATIREQWVTNWNAKNLEPIVKLYAQDAVLLPSTGQRIEGRDAIGNYLKRVMVSSTGNLSVTSVSEEDAGKLAFDSGSFQDAVKAGGGGIGGNGGIGGRGGIGGGGQRRVEGNYLIVLKRGPGGKWLIVQHASTEVPPAAN